MKSLMIVATVLLLLIGMVAFHYLTSDRDRLLRSQEDLTLVT